MIRTPELVSTVGASVKCGSDLHCVTDYWWGDLYTAVQSAYSNIIDIFLTIYSYFHERYRRSGIFVRPTILWIIQYIIEFRAKQVMVCPRMCLTKSNCCLHIYKKPLNGLCAVYEIPL